MNPDPTETSLSLPGPGRVVQAWSEVPAFDGEDEEAAYWAQSQIDVRLMSEAIHKAVTPESAAIVLKLDPRMLARLKRLARSRYLDHHSMILQWLAERLEKES